jgi:hypothetical protein
VPASQQGANTLLATPVQQTLVPIHAAAIEKISGNPTEGGHATPVASPTIIASYHAQDVGSAAGAPAASRTTSVKHAYTFEPSPKVQEAAQHPTHKSAHRVLDNTLLVQYTHRKEMPGTAISAPVWSSAHVVQLALPSQEAENSSQTEEKSSTHHMVRWASSPAALSSFSARPYLSAQGHQVRFERQAGGAWLAQVQDVWGRVQRLPVICAPDQTPEQAIQLLADKDPAQCKYWVHVLETDQLPWAPRFVYVGGLGIRGGGNSSSHDHGSSGRSNRESRRDRDDFFNDNRHTGVTLGAVGIGPQGPEMRFGPRNHHAESMAANNAVNEAMRSASETRRSSTNTSTSGPSLGSYTSTFPRSSLDIPTFPRSGLNINTSSRPPTAYETMRRISSHSSRSSSDVPRWMLDSVLRSCDNDIADSGPTSQFSGSTSTPFSTSYTRQHSTDIGTRFANRNTDRQDYSATDHQEKTQSQEADNRPRQGEQQHARAERRDYEDFCGGEAPAPPTTNSASGQQRAKAPQRRWSPSDLAFQADISKNAYFLWKEKEEIRISKEAEKHAKQIYFSQWQKQEERRRQEASLREQEERRARLDETYRREERRRQEASLREQEDRRARLDETYRQDERRRQEAEAHTMASSAAPVPSASPTATTAPNTQQQRSGAVVSQGLVLDGEGKLKPYEVRVPFAAPRAYQAFSEVRAATAVQDARSADTVKKTTKTQTALQQSVAAYQQSCEVDAGFQQQRSALSQLRERLKSEASNEGLVRQYQEQEAEFQQHPLYQQGCDLAKEAQKLREAESAKADDIIMGSSTRMKLGVERAKLRESGQHRQAATGIRDDLLQPVREILKRPSTPPRLQSVGRFAKGVSESAVGTAKGIVSLPVVAVKCLGGAAHSLSTWEDKLGIGEKITDASELVKAFCEERKYEWENPEEYQSRFQAAQRYRNELNIAEKALNAEAYHKKDAQILGYWSGEALQAVFGAEIIKGSASLVKGTQKAAKASQKVSQGSEAAKAVKTSQKVAQGTEAAKGVARAAERIEQGAGTASAVQRAEKEAARAAQAGKEVQAAQQAESVGNTVQVAKATGRVERAASVEQIMQEASPQVQEVSTSLKAWLGEGSKMV